MVACTRYLRLTETESNRLLSAAGFEPEFPLQAESVGAQPFAAFQDKLFAQLAQAMPYPISLLLSPAHWGSRRFGKSCWPVPGRSMARARCCTSSRPTA